MIPCNNWPAVLMLLLTVVLPGERVIREHAGDTRVALESPGETWGLVFQGGEKADKLLAPDELRADFRIARQSLEEGHGGIYRYTSKAELDRVFDEAEKLLTTPMSTLAFYRLLAPVVAAIKCGHTEVAFPRDFMKGYTAKHGILPLEVRVLEGKSYVWRDLSGNRTSLMGMEIRSINGVSTSSIAGKMLAAASGDGDIQTIRMRRISGWRFSSQLLALIGISSPYDISLWDSKTEREVKVQLAGVDSAGIQEAARAKFPQDFHAKTAGDFKLEADDMIAVMKIRGFGGFVDTEGKKSLEEFFRESFDMMKA